MISSEGMTKISEKRKTLMDVYDRLMGEVELARSVGVLSEQLVRKLERTENIPNAGNESYPADKKSNQDDIVDLFAGIAIKFNEILNIAGNNIEKAKSFID